MIHLEKVGEVGDDSRNSVGMGLIRARFLPDLGPIGLPQSTLHANCGRAIYVDRLLGLAQGESNAALGAQAAERRGAPDAHLPADPRDPAMTNRAAVGTGYLREGHK